MFRRKAVGTSGSKSKSGLREALYADHVTQAHEGCDFDFLQGTPGETPEPEIF